MSDIRYPLNWPEGWPRTAVNERKGWSSFKVSEAVARDEMLHEIELLGGKKVIISTNTKLRGDGLPYANQKRIDNQAVAVYFNLKGKPMTLACDMYTRFRDNYRAVGKTIECLRGIERYGASQLLERAFKGFVALPEANGSWRQILGVSNEECDLSVVKSAYRRQAQQFHPDRCNGDTSRMAEINQAYSQAKDCLNSSEVD